MGQLALHESFMAETSPTPTPQAQIRLLNLNWNIRNPSLSQAQEKIFFFESHNLILEKYLLCHRHLGEGRSTLLGEKSQANEDLPDRGIFNHLRRKRLQEVLINWYVGANRNQSPIHQNQILVHTKCLS